jgi:predicted DsbA family dithiol-disulfide isomerase
MHSSENIQELLAKKYGQSLDWAQQANQQVSAMGAEYGLRFDFDRLVPTNTFDAHRLSKLAHTIEKENEAQEKIFAAYFTNGLNIADVQTLLDIGTHLGLSPDRIQAMLKSNEFKKEVQDDIASAQALGVHGVPFFLLDEKRAISGAQDVSVFVAGLTS